MNNKEKYWLVKQAGLFYKDIPEEEQQSLYEGAWGPQGEKSIPLHTGEHRKPRWLTSLFAGRTEDHMEEAQRWMVAKHISEGLMKEPSFMEDPDSVSEEEMAARLEALHEEAYGWDNLNEDSAKVMGDYMQQTWPKRYGPKTASPEHQKQVLEEYRRLRALTEGSAIGLDLHPAGVDR